MEILQHDIQLKEYDLNNCRRSDDHPKVQINSEVKFNSYKSPFKWLMSKIPMRHSGMFIGATFSTSATSIRGVILDHLNQYLSRERTLSSVQ